MGDQITFDNLDLILFWDDIVRGSQKFIDYIIDPLMNLCATNPLILLFLSVTFVKLGVGSLRRMIKMFGHGR